MLAMIMFFFFKQKTAYEMRISDWSSDVCSSDLCARQFQCVEKLAESFGLRHDRIVAVGRFAAVTKTWQIECDQAAGAAQKRRDLRPVVLVGADTMHHHRSEEHTSELQSIMRISYAVICFKKQKHTHCQLP